jgi:hypothetical protein
MAALRVGTRRVKSRDVVLSLYPGPHIHCPLIAIQAVTMSSETGLRRRHEPEPEPPATVRTSHTVALNASTDGKKKKPTKLSTRLVAWYRANQSLVFAGIAYMVFGLAWAFSKFYLVEPSVSDLYVLCTSGGSRIYTVDDAMPKVQCIGVNGTVIFERGLMCTSWFPFARDTEYSRSD